MSCGTSKKRAKFSLSMGIASGSLGVRSFWISSCIWEISDKPNMSCSFLFSSLKKITSEDDIS